MNLESLNPASVETILTRHGALSITLADAGDKPVLEPAPGETDLTDAGEPMELGGFVFEIPLVDPRLLDGAWIVIGASDGEGGFWFARSPADVFSGR